MVLSSSCFAGVFDGVRNAHVYWEAFLQASKGCSGRAGELVLKARGEEEVADIYEWQKEKPRSIEAVFDKIFINYVESDPEMLTTLGLFESLGVHLHSAFLTDRSPQSLRRRSDQGQVDLDLLKSIETTLMLDASEKDWVSYGFMKWMLERRVESRDFIFHSYIMNQMFGVLSDLDQMMTQMHQIKSRGQAESYLLRLRQIPEIFQQVIATQEESRRVGVHPPQFAIEKSLRVMEDHIVASVEDHLFYQYFEESLRAAHIENCDDLLNELREILVTTTQPAYQNLADYYRNLPLAENHGVWSLPDGDRYYRHLLKEETTTELSAEEIHQVGLQQVEAIHRSVRHLFIKEGRNDPEKSVGQLLQELGQDSRFLFENTDEGRLQCLQEYRDILDRSRKELSHYFDIKPQAGVEIEAVPEHLEEGMPGAYYYPPSLDGSRPGVFYANLRDMKEVPRYGMETLCIHEAEPGHHFQMTIQSETQMPILRKILNVNATCEGWALYAEKLAFEAGFYSDSFSEIGHFQDELLRAVRLVVDTGIHAKKWTREHAIQVMMEMTGYPHSTVATEIERYFVMPAQACSYKIGQLKILELRKKFQEKRGQNFDFKEFHNEVLTAGNVPLMLLEEILDRK